MNLSRILVLPVLLAALGALSLPVASAAPPAQRDGTVLTWHGKQQLVQLPVGQEMIPGAPRSFRVFARHDLRQTWIHFLHKKPACMKAPTFYVRALRTDGFALGSAGTYPQPGCQTGGGYEAFWAIRHGAWKQVIGTQDVPTCHRLNQVRFPSELGVHQCYDGTDVVPYTHA